MYVSAQCTSCMDRYVHAFMVYTPHSTLALAVPIKQHVKRAPKVLTRATLLKTMPIDFPASVGNPPPPHSTTLEIVVNFVRVVRLMGIAGTRDLPSPHMDVVRTPISGHVTEPCHRHRRSRSYNTPRALTSWYLVSILQKLVSLNIVSFIRLVKVMGIASSGYLHFPHMDGAWKAIESSHPQNPATVVDVAVSPNQELSPSDVFSPKEFSPHRCCHIRCYCSCT